MVNFRRGVLICSKSIRVPHCASLARSYGIRDAELNVLTGESTESRSLDPSLGRVHMADCSVHSSGAWTTVRTRAAFCESGYDPIAIESSRVSS